MLNSYLNPHLVKHVPVLVLHLLCIRNTAYICIYPNLRYNELDHSLPAWVPGCLRACVPVSTNFKYYCHCRVGKKIGLVIWTDFLSAVKVCNNHSLLVWLLVVKPIFNYIQIQINERPICYVYIW
jgi:hypothetical protein